MKSQTLRSSSKSNRAIRNAANTAARSALFESLEGRRMLNAPKVNATVFHYETWPLTISFQFDQDVSASLNSGDLKIQKIGSTDTFIAASKIVYDGYNTSTNTATFEYTQSPFEDGKY